MKLSLFVPALNYCILPGLADPTQPACNLVTFYYNSTAELASATSAFMDSGSAFRATATSTTTAAATSVSAEASSIPTAVNCVYSSGFEDPAVSTWWESFGEGSVVVSVTRGPGTNLPHSGSNMMEFANISPNPGVLDSSTSDTTSCKGFFLTIVGSSIVILPEDLTTSWQQFSSGYVSFGTNDVLFFQVEGPCTNPVTFYVDDFNVH
ncbi:hypothetical protein G7Y89_g5164 [Cudoniella acicularis]|uniref:Uncharacterized protein n=1 Tax=Cudoniella acicularis TaxID=354080 RepID=A0A8H4RQ87_9HELO|nr:hypothetical protein G7Y89_g5164 [Cudoniella acicularis]